MTNKSHKIGNNPAMREIGQSIGEAKACVQKIVGIPVLIKINGGRGKSSLCHGKVTALFPSIFTVELDTGEKRTFSYSDVHTKNVLFLKNKDTD